MYPYLMGGVIIAAILAFIFTAVSNRLKLRLYTLKSKKVSKEIKILQVSDLHGSKFGEEQEKLLGVIRKAAPDIIVITGDIVEDRGKFEGILATNNPSRPFFEGAVKIAPCYAVLGNHERFITDIDRLFSDLGEIGITLLHPENGEGIVTADYGDVRICGAADPYFTYAAINRCERKLSQILAEDKDRRNDKIENWRRKFEAACGEIDMDEKFCVLLSHRPEEYELYEKFGFDVVFSGHAHGGQWRLPPFINGVYAPHQGIFPKHAGGTYNLENGLHIVSRGLSKKRMVRIFNRPEVCLLKIIPMENKK